MKIHYGYTDGTGEYSITIDTGQCNGCGECVQACPSGIFIVAEDNGSEPKAKVNEEARKKLAFLCPGFRSCNLEQNCHDVCSSEAISHSW
jgi:Fe-S-cluster-containing hydrogenase component 2